MSTSNRIKQLGRLVELREREVERLSAEMAEKRAVRQRYLDNLARLEDLCASSGASGTQRHPGKASETLSPELSMNVGGYKQVVMKMAAAHRVDLSLHELEITNTQQLAMVAVRRREAIGQVLARSKEGLRRHRALSEQKRQDDVAAQVWLRGRK